jgi:hypothetical protein
MGWKVLFIFRKGGSHEPLRAACARLVDIAPTEIVVDSEESDWGLVGGDLQKAMEEAQNEVAPQALHSQDEDLVEA